MMRNYFRILYKLRDFVFPLLDPLTPEQRAADMKRRQTEETTISDRVSGLPSNVEILREHLEATAKLLEQEKSRQQSVESKLAGVIGLSSLAATVLFSGLVARATSPMQAPVLANWLLTAGTLYLIVQLFCALRAAVTGISRTPYSTHTAEDVLPPRNIARTVAIRQRIALNLKLLDEHRDQNNQKVSHMAVAHCAMSNLLYGLVFVAIVAAYVAIVPRTVANSPSTAVTQHGTVQNAPQVEQTLTRDSLGTPTPGLPRAHVADLIRSTVGLVCGLGIFGVGLFFLFAGKPLRNITAGIIFSGTGLLLSAAATNKLEFTVFRLDHLLDTLQFRYSSIKQTIAAPSEEFALARIATIGPFPSGEHELNDETTTVCLERAIQALGPTAPIGWELVGGVDKRALRTDRAAIYGTNQGLAMARATWVRDKVLRRVGSAAASEAIVAVAGASNIGLRVDDSHLTADRTVQVYAFITKTQAAQQRTTATCH